MRVERRITHPESRAAHTERRNAAERKARELWPAADEIVLSFARGTYFAAPLPDGRVYEMDI